MTVQKFTLVYVAALLMMVPANAQVPISTTIVNPPKPSDLGGIIIATDPPYYLFKQGQALELLKRPQFPMEYQKRYLPLPEYDHPYDGQLTLLRSIEPMVYRACNGIKPGQNKPMDCALTWTQAWATVSPLVVSPHTGAGASTKGGSMAQFCTRPGGMIQDVKS